MDERALLQLINAAYTAAEDPRAWTAFLDLVVESIGSGGAVLLHHDLSSAGSVSVASRVDPEAMRLYNDHYASIDPRALSPLAPRLAVPGRAVVDERLVSYADVQKTAYHNDFALKHGIARLVMLTLDWTNGSFSGLSCMRSHSDPPFGPREVRFLEGIAPHAARAFRIHQLLIESRAAQAGAFEALDRVPTGVLLVDVNATVVHANAAARSWLSLRDGLGQDNGALRAASPAMTRALRGLCAECANTTAGSGSGCGGALNLPRPSGRRSFQVLVSPVKANQPFGLRHSRPLAVVLVWDPEEKALPYPALLQVFYGLTPAEAAVAQRLAGGDSPEEVADLLGYTRETARWYSKQVLAKTGCRSRSALAAELSKALASMKVRQSES